jgi:type II secretory pathway component PulF
MLSSGMSVVEAMVLVGELLKDARLKKGLESARQDVLSGSSLGAALAGYPKAFPPMVVQMVEAGEATGALNEVMQRLTLYYEREAETRAKIKEALTYPTLVAFVAVIAINVLVFFVLPNFVDVFESMNMKLPWMTQFIINGSKFLIRWWWAILVCLVGVTLGCRQWLISPKGNIAKDQFLIKAPIIGPTVAKFVFSRMSRSLSLLARSGVPMVEALRIVEKLVMNIQVAHAIAHVRASVERGSSLTAALLKEKVFPRMLIQMVQVGEETGSMDVTLDHLADFYEREAGYAVKSLTSMLEPIIIVCMTGIVLFLALAVVIPMFQMSTTVPGA